MLWYYAINRTVTAFRSDGKGTRAMSALADVIRRWLEHNSKSQNELARLAGIRTSSLSYIVNKEDALPKPVTIKKLAAAMDVDGVVLTALLGYPTQPRGQPADEYVELARRLEALPWLVERLNDLLHLDQKEFQEVMDYLDYRRRNVDQSNR